MRIKRASSLLPWLVLAPAAAFALRRLDNGDTWWHLASGRWIAENGRVPAVDTLSYTVTDHAWINLQWLWDLTAYGIFRVGGADTLVLVAAACYVAGTAVLVLNVRRHAGPLVSTVLCAWVVLIVQERFVVRPEMVTLLFLQLTLWLLADARGSQGRRLWLLAPLMLLWVNLHSLFIIGLWVVACSVAAALAAEHLPLPRTWREADALEAPVRRRLLIAAGLCVLAVPIGPYFLRGAVFPFELMTRFDKSSAYASIGEFSDPFARLFPGPVLTAYQILIVCGVLLAVVAGLASLGTPASRRRGEDVETHFDLAGLLAFIGLAYVSLLARRNAALFAMGAAPFLARCLHGLWVRRAPGASRPTRPWGLALPLVTALGLLAATGFIAGNRYYRWSATVHEFGVGVLDVSSPVRAAAFVEKHALPGRMYNDMTTGGYLSWARPTGDGVYIDGRLEVYDEFFIDYRTRLFEPAAWSERADELGIRSVLLTHRWRNRYTLIGWLEQSPDWELVYFDEVAMVWVRARDNGELIRRAKTAFVDLERENRERLLAPPSTWGYPVGAVRALDSYALLLSNLGLNNDASVFFAKTLDYDLPREDARENSLWLADFYRSQGDLVRTRRYIRRAERADPDHEAVRRAREWLDNQ